MSFIRHSPVPGLDQVAASVRPGPNGTSLVSTGLAHVDGVIGGGIPVGTIFMVLEDIEGPHHLLLLRYFIAQGVSHGQPILFGSSLSSPKPFLTTLPAVAGKDANFEKEEALRIAWQYRKYSSQQQAANAPESSSFATSFDLRKPLDRAILSSAAVDCFSFQEANSASFRERCKDFLAKISRSKNVGRIALHSLGAPHCNDSEWDILRFVMELKLMMKSANAVAIITIPTSLLKSGMSLRLQHLADTVVSVQAINDDGGKETDDTVGLLHIHKLPSVNSQVPVIPESGTYAMKLVRKKEVIVEPLQLAPVDGQQSGVACMSPSMDY